MRSDLAELPPGWGQESQYLTQKRLQILSPDIETYLVDPEIGRPVPYATFWFADALKLRDRETVRELALAMVYSSIIVTLHDDAKDNEKQNEGLKEIETIFRSKYKHIFSRIFYEKSKFWPNYYYCESELSKYDAWNSRPPEPGVDPLSDDYLWESSRYFSACVLPSLAAIAVLTDQLDKIGVVERFLRPFSMGWRIYDDIKDWVSDLNIRNYNRSTILLEVARMKLYGNPINESDVHSALLSQRFVAKVYETMIKHFEAAKNSVSYPQMEYLTKFMDEQISYQKRQWDNLEKNRDEFYKQLLKVLENN